MKNRVQSSGSPQALRIFYLERHARWAQRTVVLLVLLAAAIARADGPDGAAMTRRQQGILTGMPFMANVASRTFVDNLGRKIFLAKPPVRVVSLAPSVTEMLYAIGSGEQVVGVTDFCDYPPDARRKPKIGYSQPNLESIVALTPDLVLAPREFLRPDLLAALEQLKIPVYVLEAKTIEDVLGHVQALGRILGRPEAADALAQDMRRRIGEVKARTEARPRPRLLYVLNSEPLITVGPGSFIHQLIELAGGTNVARRATVPYPRLSMEEVVRQDPEILLFPVGKAEAVSEAEQQAWRRWTSLTAVKRQQFRQIQSDLLNRPGPRVVEGLEALALILHPDAFAEGARSR